MKSLFIDLGIAFRIAVLTLSAMAGVLVMIACAEAANAASLKSDVMLNASVLTAGDLFDGLDQDKAAKILGPAPQPGQDMVLNAMTLMQVAAALNIDWKPQSTADAVTVRTSSTAVDQQTIHDALIKKLQDKGVSGEFDLTFFNSPKLILPHDVPATAEVANITYHTDSDRFEATLIGPSLDHPQGTIQISGHVEHMMSVPMLKQAIHVGDIISADSVEWKNVPIHSVTADQVIDADQLIGKTPRRMAMADQPLHSGDLTDPLMVTRGEPVTIVYEKGMITVTAKGTAMENGSKGTLIHVVNNTSSRSIDGTVSDTGTVTVDD
jgi:flagella basal body P-ring formation protein FlgA